MTITQDLLIKAIRERHAERCAWLDRTGAQGHVHVLHDDIKTLLDILDPPKPLPKKLVLKSGPITKLKK